MGDISNLTYNDFSAGQVAGSSLSVDRDLYFDLG